MTSKIEKLLEEIQKLGDELYQDLLIQAFDHRRPPHIQKAIVNAIRKRGSRNASKGKNEDKKESGVDTQGTVLSWPTLSCGNTKSAWSVPFIYRGDLVPEGEHVFFDVEKVSLKTDSSSHKLMACVAAVVNEQNDLIFWSVIKPEVEVCQYFPCITGVNKEKLEFGLPLNTVSYFTELCFKGNKVVGFDMKDDLKSLNIAYVTNQEDLADYFYEKKIAPNSFKEIKESFFLRDLTKHFFQKEIQCSIHSAVADARQTRNLWKKKQEIMVAQPIFNEKVIRSAKKSFQYNKEDVCTCPNTKANRKRKYLPS